MKYAKINNLVTYDDSGSVDKYTRYITTTKKLKEGSFVNYLAKVFKVVNSGKSAGDGFYSYLSVDIDKTIASRGV